MRLRFVGDSHRDDEVALRAADQLRSLLWFRALPAELNVFGCGVRDRRGVVGVCLARLRTVGADLLEEHFNLAADPLFVNLLTHLRLQFEQSVVAQLLCFKRNIVDESIDRDCARSRRILKNVVVFEGYAAHKVARSFKLFVGLRGEADDEITCNCRIRKDVEDAVHELLVLAHGIAAVHEFENPIGTRLRGCVDIIADPRCVAHHLQRVDAEVARVTRHEANAPQMRDFVVNSAEQIREGRRAQSSRERAGASECRETWPNLRLLASVASDCGTMHISIVIHRLPEQRDLEHACIGEAAAFFDDGIRRAMHFRATRVRDDAVGAELIATACDSDIRAATFSCWIDGLKGAAEIEEFEIVLRCGERGGTPTLVACERGSRVLAEPGGVIAEQLTRAQILDEIRKAIEFARTTEQVDLRVAAEHVLAISFRHASNDAEHHIFTRAFALCDQTEAAVRLVFGLFPNAAGVVEDNVRGSPVLHEAIAERDKCAAHKFAVEFVHLASERLEVDGRCGGKCFGHCRQG